MKSYFPPSETSCLFSEIGELIKDASNPKQKLRTHCSAVCLPLLCIDARDIVNTFLFRAPSNCLSETDRFVSLTITHHISALLRISLDKMNQMLPYEIVAALMEFAEKLLLTSFVKYSKSAETNNNISLLLSDTILAQIEECLMSKMNEIVQACIPFDAVVQKKNKRKAITHFIIFVQALRKYISEDSCEWPSFAFKATTDKALCPTKCRFESCNQISWTIQNIKFLHNLIYYCIRGESLQAVTTSLNYLVAEYIHIIQYAKKNDTDANIFLCDLSAYPDIVFPLSIWHAAGCRANIDIVKILLHFKSDILTMCEVQPCSFHLFDFSKGAIWSIAHSVCTGYEQQVEASCEYDRMFKLAFGGDSSYYGSALNGSTAMAGEFTDQKSFKGKNFIERMSILKLLVDDSLLYFYTNNVHNSVTLSSLVPGNYHCFSIYDHLAVMGAWSLINVLLKSEYCSIINIFDPKNTCHMFLHCSALSMQRTVFGKFFTIFFFVII